MWKEEKNVTSPWQSCQFALRSYWWKQAQIYDKEGKKSHVSENNRNRAKQRKAKTTSMERWSILQSCWRSAGVGQTEIVGGGGDQGSMLSLSALPERSPQGERVPSGPPHIHLKRVHSLHTPNIGLSIFCSLCCCLTDIFIHIFEKVCTCLSLPLCNQYNGNVLTSKQKGKKNCFDKPNLNKSKQESRCSSTSIMQLCVSACFCHIYNMVQCEGTFSLSTAVKASPCSW